MINKSLLAIIGLAIITIGVLLAINTAKADTEPNNNFSEAEIIASGIYEGNVSSGDKYDIYGINLQSGEVLYANLTRVKDWTSINISIYDENQTFVIGEEKYEANNEIIKLLWITNSSGNNYFYYLDITHLGALITPYKLEVGIMSQNDVNSGKDAGNELNTSTKVSSGIYENNILGNYDTSDYYNITLKEEESLKIKINSTADYDLYLLEYLDNGNYTIIAYSNNSGIVYESVYWATNSSKENYTFYLLVSGTATGKYSLEILINKQNDGNYGRDAGDSFENAIPIIANKFIKNIVGGYDTDDFYKIIVNGGDKIIVKLEDIANFSLYLYNENKEEKINTTFSQFSWTTGSYKQNFVFYILIVGKNFSEYSLDFMTTNQNDANFGEDGPDIFKNGFSVSKDIDYSGNLEDDDKIDSYQINVSGVEVKIILTSSYNFTASIYGEDEILRTSGKNVVWLTNSSNNIYYIVIEGNENGKYNFKITLTPQNDANKSKDSGDNFENAILLESGKYYGNKIGYDDIYDYFKINISAERTIIVNVDKDLIISIYDATHSPKGRKWEGKKIWHSDVSQTIYIKVERKIYSIYTLEISFSDSRPSDVVGFNTFNATNDVWTKFINQQFNWLPSSPSSSEFGIRGYYYSRDGTKPNLNSEFTKTTSFSWNDISDGIYTIKISAVDYADAFSNVYTFILKVDTKKPNEVKVEIKEITENSIQISWEKNDDDDFVRYEIEYSTEPKFPEQNKKLITILNKDDTTYIIKGLTPGTKYYLKVSVLDGTNIRSDTTIHEISTKQRTEIPIFLILAIVIIAIAILSAIFFVMRRKKMPKKKKKMEKKKEIKKEEIKFKKEEIAEKRKEIKVKEEIQVKKEEEISGEELWKHLRKKR